jgi:crotonobetainyl-CoA:carnitine CoA-transferase CaiB-like acyl-CoA transferase
MNTRYRCADGTWLIMSSHDQASWPHFCRALGREDLIADPRWDTPTKRFTNAEELVALFDDLFGSAPYAHWAERLEGSGIIWSEVAEVPALVDDPQARQMGMYAAIEHPTVGRLETLQAPFTLSDSQVRVRGPAPDIGDDTDDVLRDLGLVDEEVAALREAGVVGRREPASPREPFSRPRRERPPNR